MDNLDSRIISLLSENARYSISELAKKLEKARTTIQTRIERLEKTGVIAGYSLRLGSAESAQRIKATVLIQFDPNKASDIMQRLPAVLRTLDSLSPVQKVITVSGRFDLLLELATQNMSSLDEALDQIGKIAGVRKTESLIQLSTKLNREAH